MNVNLRGEMKGQGRRVAVVASRFNIEIVQKLVDGALDSLRKRGVTEADVTVVWVPGAWEIPIAVRALGKVGGFDGFVTLGAILQGETTHHEHLGREVAASLMRFMDESGLPVAFGVLTCDCEEKAFARAGGEVGHKGVECVEALLETFDVLERSKTIRS
jgi:6,7-dimethyl-8-ribityllumazine synthase